MRRLCRGDPSLAAASLPMYVPSKMIIDPIKRTCNTGENYRGRAPFARALDQNVPSARTSATAGGGAKRAQSPGGPPAASTPHLPDDPYLGANSGKPDFGGNSQSITAKMSIWRVPYIIDMQKQGCALGDQACYESLGLPERVVFVLEGGAHVWRNIWLDGRQQPKDPNPTYLGYSTGKWEGIRSSSTRWVLTSEHGSTPPATVMVKSCT